MSENPNSSPEPDTLERLVADSPSIEVISSAWMLLMSAAAEKLGLTDGHDDAAEGDDEAAQGADGAAFDPRRSPHFDLDEARRLITALAGLTTASVEYLGPHAGPYRDGLKSLQLAFREYSSFPDEPGQGPGEKYTGPVYG